MVSRLRYKVLYATSEDPEYPVSELLHHSSRTKGWSSSRFCDYPQELSIVFDGPVSARQIQFLSHQSKIASRVELFVDEISSSNNKQTKNLEIQEQVDILVGKLFGKEGGTTNYTGTNNTVVKGGLGGNNTVVNTVVKGGVGVGIGSSTSAIVEDESAIKASLLYLYDKKIEFRRLGYLSLDSNERSQFQARELKSVYIDQKTRFLKIRLHKCHLNKFNLTNQVSLIAINVLGEGIRMVNGMVNGGMSSGMSNNNSGNPATAPALQNSGNPALQNNDNVGSNSISGSNSIAAGGAKNGQNTTTLNSNQSYHTSSGTNDQSCQSSNHNGGGALSSLTTKNAASNDASNLIVEDQFSSFDPKIAEKLRALTKAKEHSVGVEDFEAASRYKQLIENLKKVAGRITECEAFKKKAVAAEDYDSAKQLKLEIDSLYRAAIVDPKQETVKQESVVESVKQENARQENAKQENAKQEVSSRNNPVVGSRDGMNSLSVSAAGGAQGGGYYNYDQDDCNATIITNGGFEGQHGQHMNERGQPRSETGSGIGAGGGRYSSVASTGGIISGNHMSGSIGNSSIGNFGGNSISNSMGHSNSVLSASENTGIAAKLPANNEDVPVGGRGAYVLPDDLGQSSSTSMNSGMSGNPSGMGNNSIDRDSGGGNSKRMNSNTNAGSTRNGSGSSINGEMNRSEEMNSVARDIMKSSEEMNHNGNSMNNSDPSHPLYGVPNCEDLPIPEMISSQFSQEVQPLLKILSEYLIRCLYSKVRNLREAGLQKLNHDLSSGVYDDRLQNLGFAREMLQNLILLLKRTSADKIANVFLLSMHLAQTLCTKVILAGEENGFYLKKSDTQPLLDVYVPQLVERLGDANVRVSQSAGDAVLSFALCPNVGSNFVSQYLIRTESKAEAGGGKVVKSFNSNGGKKQVWPSRVYCNRVKLLTILTSEIGVAPYVGGGISLEPLMVLAMRWFASPLHEVRQAIVELVGVVYSRVGLAVIEVYLKELRPVQREVFDTEFYRIGGENYWTEKDDLQRGLLVPSQSGGGHHQQLPPVTVVPQQQNNGLPSTTSRKSEHDQETLIMMGGGEIHQEQQIKSQCQFCNEIVPQELDLHYWRTCLMLTECKYCQQVIEISGLREHFLTECESFPTTVTNDTTTTTGDDPASSIRNNPAGSKKQVDESKLPLPETCPLCDKALNGDNPQVWYNHLMKEGCEKNPRKCC